jgi:hypothetical protein
LKADIDTALAGVRAEAVSVLELNDDQQDQFLRELGGFVKLTGGGWPAEQRQEFIEQAAVELAEVPVALLVPAIRDARRTIWDPKRFVSWIFERVDRDLRKLNTEREQLEQLRAIAAD